MLGLSCELKKWKAESTSTLTQCYTCDVAPGLSAFIAILICLSRNLLGDKRMLLNHFKLTLGVDMEAALKRKLTQHVRKVAEEVIATAANKLAFLAAKEKFPADGEKKANDGNSERTAMEAEKEEKEQDEEYKWLLVQLRTLLLSYSLLDEFLQSEHLDDGDFLLEDECQLAWPVVCLLLFHLILILI
jgi:ribosomal protein L12E/L44/L45/RPP1/RPP2